MTTLERQSITGSAIEVGFDLERLIHEGWEIDEDEPLQPFGFGLLVGLIRDPANAKDPEPKLSRAEILAKARQAKADKAKREANVE